VSVAHAIASDKRPSFITNFVEAEAHALLVRKLGRAIARQWLLTGGLPVVPASPAEEHRAKEILARHTDKDWTLCDAISFAVLDARHVLPWARIVAPEADDRPSVIAPRQNDVDFVATVGTVLVVPQQSRVKTRQERGRPAATAGVREPKSATSIG
jgi:hypothetical protein